MTLIDNPQTLPELQAAFARVDGEVTRYFDSIAVGKFFEHPPQVWSPAENVIHLVKSVKPVGQALRLPKLVPQMLFGAAGRPSQNFGELITTYKGKLAEGATSPGQFVPELGEPGSDLAAAKSDVMKRWKTTIEKFETALATWSDADLDRYQLPHPLLGKLTVREMLFFTVYHNLHHMNDVRALLGEAKLEV